MFTRYQTGIKALLFFMLLIASGCSASVKSAVQPNSTSNRCPEQPEGSLASNDVKSVWLGTQSVKETGMVSPDKYLGYTFEAKSEQILSYRTNDNICIWVYTPDNQLLTSTKLPSDGKYLMQVAALTGSTTFEVEMSLDQPRELSQTANYQPATTHSQPPQASYKFSFADFPKPSCGDPLPTDANDYPVTFYPVFVPYSETNLAKARSLFCQDSLKVRRKDTKELSVQIASFTDEEESRSFAEFIETEISETEVGKPTVRHLNE